MADCQQHWESKRGGFLPILLPPLLLVSYPLSTGPVVLLLELGWLGPDRSFWIWFYRPIGFLMDQSSLIQDIIVFYINLWAQFA